MDARPPPALPPRPHRENSIADGRTPQCRGAPAEPSEFPCRRADPFLPGGEPSDSLRQFPGSTRFPRLAADAWEGCGTRESPAKGAKSRLRLSLNTRILPDSVVV